MKRKKKLTQDVVERAIRDAVMEFFPKLPSEAVIELLEPPLEHLAEMVMIARGGHSLLKLRAR